MSFLGLLNTTVKIKSRTPSTNAIGEVTYTFTDVATDVKSRKHRVKDPKIGFESYQLTLDTFKFYFLPSQTGLEPENVIEHESEDYEIIQAVKDSAGHHWEVLTTRKHYD